MPRPKRICIPGLPHHVVQRGNNRIPTFYHSDDYTAYLTFLIDAVTEHKMNVHAYVLMTNHVHLLVTPTDPDGLSLTMQSQGRRYVTYINKAYHRTGILWQGRFESSVVDSETYCLTCYRYNELNPLRANIVANPADYRWIRPLLLEVVEDLFCDRVDFASVSIDGKVRNFTIQGLAFSHQ